MAMKEIDIREVKENLVHLLADEWALVTAGRGDALGTMTVSWGGIGELWGKDMATIYIRPQRYTKKFLDENNYFTLSFYPEQYKDALRLCGVPAVEVMLHAPDEREPFRKTDVVSFGCQGHFIGEGPQGYLHACIYLAQLLRTDGSSKAHIVM